MQNLILKNVMYIPKLRCNLMSSPTLGSMGISFSCKNYHLTLFSNNGKKDLYGHKWFLYLKENVKDKKAFIEGAQKC